MELKKKLSERVVSALSEEFGCVEVNWEHPEREEFGDYSTNLALIKKGGRVLAEKIADALRGDERVEKVSVDGPGFVNVYLKNEVWQENLTKIETLGNDYGNSGAMRGKKIMVEYAHPNTHKELHVGHMRTLITGEALARIFEKNGATVFRANYQGDIGPHVAKAIWGTQKIMSERKLDWAKAEELGLNEKAHLLGEGYILGSGEYEGNKQEIDKLNKDLYEKKTDLMDIYELTRQWSLDYYKSFYQRFGTKFDRLFFESEVANRGLELVRANMGTVFEVSDGAVIFNGEKYGLHKRVFVTSDGNPTYEGKEMGLAHIQYETFPFDQCIHVVANEQSGYFSVVIKALETLNKSFVGREVHLAMGMVNLVGRKMSSRTGEVLTVGGLIEEIKSMIRGLIRKPDISAQEIDEISETISLAAIKYSVLKSNPELNVAFDPKQSISLEGSSGPYLQYTYARCRSVIVKAGNVIGKGFKDELADEELRLMRWLGRYPEAVREAGERMAPNLVATYLHELAARFNSFYNQHSILSADNKEVADMRVRLTVATAQVLRNGLGLLGIETLERM